MIIEEDTKIPIVVGAVTMETKQTELYEKVYSSIF